ncbi:hypothetical protein SKAU_G00127250 [Synaphobranchus kaupii]|uniref:Uncharacterized protein n=1 Tax=Synaphobranchus kaupii TaxID=118154 RepID=A0A9Q1FPX5_SYNKA|nr:hypothetical protein SKAU_G00127250 [Synaphobranchus kaupii]
MSKAERKSEREINGFGSIPFAVILTTFRGRRRRDPGGLGGSPGSPRSPSVPTADRAARPLTHATHADGSSAIQCRTVDGRVHAARRRYRTMTAAGFRPLGFLRLPSKILLSLVEWSSLRESKTKSGVSVSVGRQTAWLARSGELSRAHARGSESPRPARALSVRAIIRSSVCSGTVGRALGAHPLLGLALVQELWNVRVSSENKNRRVEAALAAAAHRGRGQRTVGGLAIATCGASCFCAPGQKAPQPGFLCVSGRVRSWRTEPRAFNQRGVSLARSLACCFHLGRARRFRSTGECERSPSGRTLSYFPTMSAER